MSTLPMNTAEAPTQLVIDGSTSVETFTLDIAFTADPDTTVAIVGSNGAGKSTLLNVLSGLTTLESGSLVFKDRTWDDPAQGIHLPPEGRDIALVPQNALLFPHLCVVDNVAFGLRYRQADLTRREQRTKALDALEVAGLAQLADRRPHQLSGGQRQRSAIIRALLTEPGLLLLDEPLSNVDTANRQELRQAIDQLRPEGQIQVVVTHGHDHATTADQVVALHHGKVSASGTPAEVAASTSLGWLRDLLSTADG